MIDDVTLLRRFSQESSQEAFAELVRRHIALVYSAAFRCLGNDFHLAEDVTQTVFSGLAQKAASLRIQSSLTGWLYCRARSAAIDVIRSEQRRRHREQQALAIAELSTLRPTTPDWDRLRPEIEDAIEELKESDRDVVLLRFFEHQSFSEIGALLNISEDTAQKRADRALEKMRAVFARRGITSTTAVLAGLLANQAAATVPAGLSTAVTAAALASATSVGALTAVQSILNFMSTTKLGLGIAGMVTLCAIGSAVFEGNAASRAQTSLAAAQASLAAATATHKSDLAKQQELTRIVADDDKMIAQQPVAHPGRPSVQISDIIKEHPEFQVLYSKMIRRRLNAVYGDGLNSLKLTPDQLNKLKGLLTEREMSIIDANQAAVAAGLRPGSTEWQEAMNQASLTNDQDIQGLLGPNADTTLAELKANAGQTQAKMLVQSQVGGLSSDFTDAGFPLTADQSNALTQALLNGWYWQGRDLSDRPVNYNDVDPNTGLSPHDIRNINNAAQVLTPAQLAVFKDYENQMEQVYAIQRQYKLPLDHN